MFSWSGILTRTIACPIRKKLAPGCAGHAPEQRSRRAFLSRR